jgi:RNA methyltransferase, TrmH family
VAAVGVGGDEVADFVGGVGVMIGNEGAGLSEEWLGMADARVTIRCPGPVESLNAAVAGSLLLYEASKVRGTRYKGQGENVREAGR